MKPAIPSQRLIAGAIIKSASYKPEGKTAATRKQLKHDMLLTFIAQSRRPKQRPIAKKRSILSAVLSLFL